jgi:hypothetical protein
MRKLLTIVSTPQGLSQVYVNDRMGWSWVNRQCAPTMHCQGCSTVEEHLLNINAFDRTNNMFDLDVLTAQMLLTELADHGDPPSTDPMPLAYLPRDKGLEKRFTDAVSKLPVVCKKCNLKNDFGASNQADGSYICYVCR